MRNLPLVSSVVAALLLAAVGRADPATVALANPSSDFALNPATGVLAAVETAQDTVRFYPSLSSGKSADAATALSVAKGPANIIFKKFGNNAYFLVLCRDANKLVLIDAATLKPLKDIPLSVTNPSFLAASLSPDDPYVYIPGNPDNSGRSPSGGNVVAVDLRAQKDVGTVSLGGDLGGRMSDGAISADGRIAYSRATNVSPSGFTATALLRGEEGKPPATSSLYYNHTTVPGYVADPFAQTVAVGNDIYSADLKQKLGTTDNPVAAFHPNKPFMFALRTGPAANPDAPDPTPARAGRGTAPRGGITGRAGAGNNLFLSAISFNSLKTLASLDLGPEPLTGLRGGYMSRPVNHVLVDPKNDNVLVCTENDIRVASLKDLHLPAQTLLVASLEGNTQLAVGKPATLKILRQDPAAKLELKDAPKGMSLQNDTLSWTPGPDDVGEINASLRLSAGDSDRTQQFALRVSREFIRLPFAPDTLEISPDGTTALIATSPNGNGLPRGVPGAETPANSRLALIDLKTSAVLADRTLLANASAFAVDAKYAYAALRDSEAFYILARKDLTEVKRLFSQGHVTSFLPRGDRLLVTTDSGNISLISLTDFSVIDSPAAKSPANNNPMYAPSRERAADAVVDLGDAVLVNGILLDSNLNKIKALARLDALRSVSLDGASNYPDYAGGGNRAAVTRWGVGVNSGGALVRANGQAVGQFNANGSVLLATQPIVASFTLTSRQAPNAGTVIRQTTISRGDLAFRDVLAGAPQQTLHVFDEPLPQEPQRDRFGDRQPTPLRAAKQVALIVADRLFLIDLPAADPAKFPAPPQFSTDQGVVVLAADKPTTLRMAATTSAGTLEYSLSREIPGIDIDKATGAVTIQPNAFTDRALDALAAQGNPIDLPSYQKTAGTLFKTLAGREPAGIPAALSFTVSARDKNLQSTSAERLVLLEIPTDKFTQRLAAGRPGDRASGPFAPASRPLGSRGANPAANPDDPAARIDALEKRINTLEAKIDLLTQILNDKNK